ncbi:MAG TPA: flagellar basal-body MS-ring/collar protein FliF [Sphingomonas sp.]|jgi:flagellar M-ring protein FliF
MSNALAPAAGPSVPERFANPLQQVRGLLAQPAVRRAGPAALAVGLVGAAALAWATLATPPQKVLFAGLPDADKAAVTAALEQADIPSAIDEGTGAVTVAEDDHSRARMLLASQNLPKAAPGGYAILDQLPMGVSRAVEGERLRQARETELARSIQEIDTVAEARVHLAMPEVSVFVRDTAKPSASVILKLQPGRTLTDAQVGSIVNLVSSSVPGMKPDDVTVVDQLGGLLSKRGDASEADGDKRIEFQRRVEDKYRLQLQQLLTPLVGGGNFTAEVQADVDLNETQATRETYDKQGALRAETGDWTGFQQGDPTVPGGIPGALSNTPPPASTLQAPQPATGAPGVPTPPAVAGGPAPNPMKQQDRFQRAYDLDREVSVTRAAPGGVKRLSVAVLLREPETGRRSQAEIDQITNLVRSAVGFDQSRNDSVTVISRKFAGAPATDEGRPWYDNAWFPVLARNLTAVVIALLVLLLGVRPLVRSMTRKKSEEAVVAPAADAGDEAEEGQAPAVTVAPPVSLDEIETSRSFEERVGAVRGFTRDNPARAALAIRDMIKADAKS